MLLFNTAALYLKFTRFLILALVWLTDKRLLQGHIINGVVRSVVYLLAIICVQNDYWELEKEYFGYVEEPKGVEFGA